MLSKEIQNGISDYTDKYQFWGSIHAAENDYRLLENRADALKNHCNDFIWLYEKLEDYRSKTVLSAIVQNWLCFEFNFLDSVREKMFPDYFDLDVFPEMRDEVFVDVGAFNGDTVDQLFNLYGSTSFQKVYCYEITPQSCSEIRNKFSEYPNAVVKQKGLGSTYGKFYIEENHTTASANTLTGLENAGVGVETVPLDKDVNEPVTFIKMDIEGAEKDALLGAKQHIAKDKPKLGIAVYHNHEDLWKIPQMLLKMNTNYQFYLRYHGGNIFPTEITLLAL